MLHGCFKSWYLMDSELYGVGVSGFLDGQGAFWESVFFSDWTNTSLFDRPCCHGDL